MILDLYFLERLSQRLRVKVGVHTRAGETAHISDCLDLLRLEEGEEIREGMRRVSDAR